MISYRLLWSSHFFNTITHVKRYAITRRILKSLKVCAYAHIYIHIESITINYTICICVEKYIMCIDKLKL